MNKARRHELKMLKYKKRLKQLRLKESAKSNLFAYRSHGSPCSCAMCSHSKFNRAKEKEIVYIQARPITEPIVLHNFGTNEKGELVKTF